MTASNTIRQHSYTETKIIYLCLFFEFDKKNETGL